MALPTFGVDADLIQTRFGNQDMSSISTRIDRWVQQASSKLDVQLHQVGYTAAGASAEGSASRFYLICQRYIESVVSADLARSNTRADPDFAKAWDAQALSALQDIRDFVESLSDSWDRNDQTGSFRQNRVDGSRFISPQIGLRSASRWRRGDPI